MPLPLAAALRRGAARCARRGCRSSRSTCSRRPRRRPRSTSTTPRRDRPALRGDRARRRRDRAAPAAARRPARRPRPARRARANYRLGALPLWRAVPGGYDRIASAPAPSAHDRIAARALRLVPAGAVVSATNNLGAHLSARRRMLSFPYLAGRDLGRRRRDAARLRRPDRADADGRAARLAAPEPGLEARLRGGRRARLPAHPPA